MKDTYLDNQLLKIDSPYNLSNKTSVNKIHYKSKSILTVIDRDDIVTYMILMIECLILVK
jgi:hypothetical protein